MSKGHGNKFQGDTGLTPVDVKARTRLIKDAQRKHFKIRNRIGYITKMVMRIKRAQNIRKEVCYYCGKKATAMIKYMDTQIFVCREHE